jgi:hypothetical protein
VLLVWRNVVYDVQHEEDDEMVESRDLAALRR